MVSISLTLSDIPSDWANTLASAEAQEQHCLAHMALGLRFEVAKDGDWIGASIGERSVVAHRFGADLHGVVVQLFTIEQAGGRSGRWARRSCKTIQLATRPQLTRVS